MSLQSKRSGGAMVSIDWRAGLTALGVPALCLGLVLFNSPIASGEASTGPDALAAVPNWDLVGEHDIPTARTLGEAVGDCQRCHVMTESLGHPVGVRPSMTTPEHLPLASGRLDCATCHETSTDSHDRARRGEGAMLRTGLAGGSAGCLTCHETPDPASRLGHAVFLGQAHLDVDAQRYASPQNAAAKLDSESQSCMACHDGSRGTSLGVSHPVGVAYDDLTHAHSDGPDRLVARHRLDPRVRLFNGTVGCGSCHSTYSERPKMVAVSMHQSHLCTSCHNPR